MRKILLLCLISMVSCSRTQLADGTLTKFSVLASQGTYPDKIQLSWTMNKYYKYYQVYRSENEFGNTYQQIFSTESDNVDDFKVTPGTEYFYQVVGYNYEDMPIFKSDIVSGFSGISSDLPPNDVKTVKGASNKEIRITWSLAATASEYAVYRATGDQNFSILERTGYTYFSDTTAEPGVIYCYRIHSVNEDGFEGKPSLIVEGLRFGINSAIISASDGLHSDKIVLEWGKAPLAVGYNIYRSLINDAPQFLKSTSKEFLYDEDASITPGQIIYYWVEAIAENGTLSDKSRVESGYKRDPKTLDAPTFSPEMIESVQGKSKTEITLSWNAVENASGYNLYRSTSRLGEYKKVNAEPITSNTVNDTPSTTQSYSYFYAISALNTHGEGARSTLVEAWTLKPPFNITTSLYYSDQIIVQWTPVYQAKEYIICGSDTVDGSYSRLATVTSSSFTENLSLGSLDMKERYYKVSTVNTDNLSSEPSDPMKGAIQKIKTPKDFKIINNHTAKDKHLSFSWALVNGAVKYRVYKATFKHRFENRSDVDVDGRYTMIAELDGSTRFYSDSLAQVPLRRHLYKITAINASGDESLATPSIEGYRYPVDIIEFIRDVDYTIYYTQQQIGGFGSMGLSATIHGRGGGYYEYASKMTDIRNNWRSITQFEIALNGDTRMEVITSPMGSSMNGPIAVTGLYEGVIEYIGLQALDGGTVANGKMRATYKHPTKGTLSTTKSVSELNALMITIRMGSDPGYSPPGPEALP